MSFFHQQPWVAIVLGTVLVAIGGLIATWGWNRQTDRERKRELVASTAREWILNDRMVSDAASLAQRWNKRTESEKFSYQRYKASYLTALLVTSLKFLYQSL